MTAAVATSLQEAAIQSQMSTLPLRQDDPVTLVLMIKVLLITAILLAITYVCLRWYMRRQSQRQHTTDRPELQCTSALRLSSRTKIYLVRSSSSELLITESSTETSVTILSGVLPAPLSGAPSQN